MDRKPESQLTDPDERLLWRRQFLALAGLGLPLLSGSLACTRAPSEKIVPYRVQPNGVVPGQPAHYASAYTVDGYATGILLESHEGRPTKIEGNPDHPASLGATSAREQALILELYHPRRQRASTRRARLSSEAAVDEALRNAALRERSGRGLHLVLPPQSSPLLASQLEQLQNRLPEAQIHFYAPLSRTAVWQGARLAFGQPLEPRFDLRRARVIAALDADVLSEGPASLALTRAFCEARAVSSPDSTMNRLYVVEPTPTVTGNMADHRLALGAAQIPGFLAALLRWLSRELPGALPSVPGDGTLDARFAAFLPALGRDLLRNRGAALLVAGDRQPPIVHAMTHALNRALGNTDVTVRYARSPIVAAGEPAHDSLATLHAALSAHEVDSLLVFDVDLAYAAPGALDFEPLLRKVPNSIYCGAFENATGAACEWSIPLCHVLESWADSRAFDGTCSIVQPALQPLYGGRTEAQILALLCGNSKRSPHELVREFWRRDRELSDEAWERALCAGVIAETEIAPPPAPPLTWEWLGAIADLRSTNAPLELDLRPDPRLGDGRFVDNSWLLELPCPITKQAWGNALRVSPALAAELGIESGDVLALQAGGRTLEAPALLVPGQASRAVTLTLGWGQGGHAIGSSCGVNGYSLMTAVDSWTMKVTLTHTGRREELAITQSQLSPGEAQESIFAVAPLAEYRARRSLAEKQRKRQLSMYESDAPRASRQWGMSIDLNACTGCSACVVACQAENSVPVVGKSGVLKHREMHWLRIDRYLVGSAEQPRAVSQPMACQHCERAPCEYVCPTAATVHSSDGLNQMVYNRCVGTRFCSNNCPYKVRRFNWFNYHASEREPAELAYNPEVTVRARGVMEKCSYCVQRIRKTEIRQRITGNTLRDGDVRSACEQVCPSGAIVFGDVADSHSRVSRLHGSERAFAALNELGTVPRTRYLAKLTNPNPELT